MDAKHLRDACEALLIAARQLLERTRELTAGGHREDSDSVTADPPGFACDPELDVSPSSLGSFTEVSSTPSSSTTWNDRSDMLSLDVDEWNGYEVWHPTGVEYAFGRTDSCLERPCDGGDWPTLSGDDWPCFPG